MTTVEIHPSILPEIPLYPEKPMLQWVKLRDIDMALNPVLMTYEQPLRPWFNKYNEKCFNGRLPKTPIYVAPSMKRFPGIFIYKIKQPKLDNFIVLSWPNLVDKPEDTMRSVLLHEMIHVWQRILIKTGESSHGPKYMAKYHEINAMFREEGSDFRVSMNSVLKPRYKRQFPQYKYTRSLRARATIQPYEIQKFK